MDTLRGLLCIMRINKVPDARIRMLCRVTKGVDENMADGSTMWRECGGNHSVGRLWNSGIITVKDCLKKKRFRCQACKENSA